MTRYPKLLLLGGILLLQSCSGTEKQPAQNSRNVAEADTSNVLVSDDQDFILPQPITLAQALKSSGIRYHEGRTNPIAHADDYALKSDQLLNFGVYSADLAYCILNEKQQEARNYLAAIRKLSATIGLDAVYSDRELADKFEQDLDNPQALEELVITIQEKSDDYLADNDLRYLASIQFAGAWIEGMYLGIADMRTKGPENMGSALTDQMNLLSNTIRGVNSYPTRDERLKLLSGDLENLLRTYETFPSVKTAGSGSDGPKLSKEEFEVLSDKIESLRSKIIKPA